MKMWDYCPQVGNFVEVAKNNGLGRIPCLTIDESGGTYCRMPQCIQYVKENKKSDDIGVRSLAEMLGDLNTINNH